MIRHSDTADIMPSGGVDRFAKAMILVYQYSLHVIALVVIPLYLLVCGDMTSHLFNWLVVAYTNDSLVLTGGLLLLVSLTLVVLHRAGLFCRLGAALSSDECFARVKRLLLGLIFAMCMLWIVSTQFAPGVDEGELFGYATQASRGDWDAFAPGHYLCRYPNNWGLFLFDLLLTHVFGGQNYLAFELVNSAAITLLMWELMGVGEQIGVSRVGQVAILLLGVFFFPITLFAIMVYGNMIGLALACAAVRHQMKCLSCTSHGFRARWLDMLACVLCMTGAMFFKSTMLIYYVAIILSTTVNAIAKKDWRLLFLPMFMVLAGKVRDVGVQALVVRLSEYSVGQPCATLAWIAMGLQESGQAPGWWNEYIIRSYDASGGNTAVQTALAKQEIVASIRKFAADPAYALDFFLQKAAATWANPSYQCFGTTRNGTFIHLPEWVRWLLTYNGQYKANGYLEFLSNVIYGGACWSLVLCSPKEIGSKRSVLILSFLGGVLYLTLSEAMARYALMFWVVLLPLAADGYERLCKVVGKRAPTRTDAQAGVIHDTIRRLSTGKMYVLGALLADLVAFMLVIHPQIQVIVSDSAPSYYAYLQAEDMSSEFVAYYGTDQYEES